MRRADGILNATVSQTSCSCTRVQEETAIMSFGNESKTNHPGLPSSPAVSTTTITTKEKPMLRSLDEQAILDAVARSRGQEWVDAHAELVLAQAREFGDL